MARISSSMLTLGVQAPDFSLPDVVSEQIISLEKNCGSKATVIMFICNHCPYVRHVNAELVRLTTDYREKGVSFIAISSNDISQYPADSPENMKKTALAQGYLFPYLFDETQEVARAYQAACTPDFYVFDGKLSLVYRGQLDDSRPENSVAVTGSSIRDALDCLLKNQKVSEDQKASLGCSIKWKK